MSTSNTHNVNISTEKFTRGEKCIFIHLVLTFSLILTVVLIYLVHLYSIDHTVYDAFKTRRSFESSGNKHIGIAYIKLPSPVAVCNTVLFTTSWSIAPGHCVAMRAEPDMAYVLSLWQIKYSSTNPDQQDPKVIRTITHPLFIKNSLAHNIGLFQHEAQDTEKFIPKHMNDRGDMTIGSWIGSDFQEPADHISYYPVTIMEKKRCYEILSFIEHIRDYEFCMTFSGKHVSSIEHGAIVSKNNEVTGIFSWGDKNGKSLPFVILNITFYQKWLRHETHSNLDVEDSL